MPEMSPVAEFDFIIVGAGSAGCLRGVSTLTAFGLAAEIGDWTRLSLDPPMGLAEWRWGG